jgi:hypothetical protein
VTATALSTTSPVLPQSESEDIMDSQIYLGITDQHYALIIISLLIITQAPTCFDTYVPSSGSVFYPCELPKVRKCCVIGMYPCTVNVGGELDK